MKFEFYSAKKNLRIRKKQTLRKVIYTTFSLYIIYLCIGLIFGTGAQMDSCLENYQGDIYFASRQVEKDITDIYTVVSDDLKDRASFYREISLSTTIISNKGYSNIILNGVEESFSERFQKTIGWIQKPDFPFLPGTCILDVKTAEILKVETGDYITISYTADDGFMNTIQLLVNGIYIGNEYLYNQTVFTNIQDIEELLLNKLTNRIKVYFNNEIDDVSLHEIVSKYNLSYFQTTLINCRTDYRESTEYMIFSYYRIFLVIVIIILIVILFVILTLSIKHLYFMEFRKRRNEISTLMAFGVQAKSVIKTVFIETVMYFIFSSIIGFFFFVLSKNILSRIKITSIRYQSFVALLGGNSIILKCSQPSFLIISLIVFAVVLISALTGVKKYFSMHIKDIISGE
jgi:ABC-type lipoprotein release transport system permease subunit